MHFHRGWAFQGRKLSKRVAAKSQRLRVGVSIGDGRNWTVIVSITQERLLEVRHLHPATLAGLSPWQPVLKGGPTKATFLLIPQLCFYFQLNQQYSDIDMIWKQVHPALLRSLLDKETLHLSVNLLITNQLLSACRVTASKSALQVMKNPCEQLLRLGD